MEQRPIDGVKPRPSRTWLQWLKTALVLTSLGFLAYKVSVHLPEIKQSAALLFGRRRGLLFLASLLEIFWLFALAQVCRWSLLAFGGQIPWRHALRVSLGAFALSRILPGGGAVGSVVAAKEVIRLGNPPEVAVVSMATSWWLSMVSLASLVAVGTWLGVDAGVVTVTYLTTPVVVLLVLVAGAGGVMALLQRPQARTRFTNTIAKALPRFETSIVLSFSVRAWRPARSMWVFIWTAIAWATDAAALWVMFYAFGLTLHPGVLLVGYGVINLISALPEVTPGWVGVLETTLSIVYAGMGVASGPALMVILSYRLLSYWLPTVAGVVPGLAMIKATNASRPSTFAPSYVEEAA